MNRYIRHPLHPNHSSLKFDPLRMSPARAEWQRVAPSIPHGQWLDFNGLIKVTGAPRSAVLRGLIYARYHGLVKEELRASGWKGRGQGSKKSWYMLGEEQVVERLDWVAGA